MLTEKTKTYFTEYPGAYYSSNNIDFDLKKVVYESWFDYTFYWKLIKNWTIKL